MTYRLIYKPPAGVLTDYWRAHLNPFGWFTYGPAYDNVILARQRAFHANRDGWKAQVIASE